MQVNDCFVFFPNLLFTCYKIGTIIYPRNVLCSIKQLFFFLYQTIFFKNDNWRVYGVELLCSLTIVASADIMRLLSREMKIYTLVMVSISKFKILV